MSNATISELNASDNPTEFNGFLRSDDGQGTQLWQFGDKFATRHQAPDDRDGDDTSIIYWSDDIEGWGYDDADDAIDA